MTTMESITPMIESLNQEKNGNFIIAKRPDISEHISKVIALQILTAVIILVCSVGFNVASIKGEKFS